MIVTCHIIFGVFFDDYVDILVRFIKVYMTLCTSICLISDYEKALCDQGSFREALHEMVDLFVSKDQVRRLMSNVQDNKEHHR